jgi:hypothetical protein
MVLPGSVVPYPRMGLLFPFSHRGRSSGIFEQILRPKVRGLNGMEKQRKSDTSGCR